MQLRCNLGRSVCPLLLYSAVHFAFGTVFATLALQRLEIWLIDPFVGYIDHRVKLREDLPDSASEE